MKLPPPTEEGDGPNLTPVIDVVFLLLIFFLVATTYEQEERELEIDLPEVALAQPLSGTSDLVINVTREGRYKIVRQEYDEQGLRAVLQEARRNNAHQRALIRADGNGLLKHTARVMGLCNDAGMDYQLASVQESD